MKPNTDVVFATDIMARGLDLRHLSHVVNFTLPRAGSYVHRAGRVGRLGQKDQFNRNRNIVISLCSQAEEVNLYR
jgi:superfamily II DNA/RNA helicase